MFKWLFKKEVKELSNNAVKASFVNIKSDMSHLGKWVDHFKTRHEKHDENLASILARIEALENQLNVSSHVIPKEESEEINLDEITEMDNKNWDMLTDVQQQLAWILMRLNKEKPGSWHSLKELAAEFYPDREYSTVRSTISHYSSLLEELGFVERKRRRNQTFAKIKKEELPTLRSENGLILEDKKLKKKKKKRE